MISKRQAVSEGVINSRHELASLRLCIADLFSKSTAEDYLERLDKLDAFLVEISTE